jgi:hypothetical protein
MTELERAEQALLSCGFNILVEYENLRLGRSYGILNPTVAYDVAANRFQFIFSAITPKELGVEDGRPLSPTHLITRLDAFAEIVKDLGGSRGNSAEVIDLYESRGAERYGESYRYQLEDCVALAQLPYAYLDKVMLVTNKIPLSLVKTFDPNVPLGFYAELNGFNLS